MQIQGNTDKHIEGREEFVPQVEATVASSLSRFRDSITRVEIHLRDENGDMNGQNDKRCMMEARIERRQPTAVTCKAATLAQAAAAGAADKMKSSLARARWGGPGSIANAMGLRVNNPIEFRRPPWPPTVENAAGQERLPADYFIRRPCGADREETMTKTKISGAPGPAQRSVRDGMSIATTLGGDHVKAQREAADDINHRALERWENEEGSGSDTGRSATLSTRCANGLYLRFKNTNHPLVRVGRRGME